MKKCLVLLLLINTACFAQKFDLTLHLIKDSTYYLDSKSAMSIEQNIDNEHKQTINLVSSGTVSHKVLAVHDTVYDVEVMYRSLKMHVEIPGVSNTDISSDDKNPQNIVTKIIRVMLNKPFNMQITNTGKILSVQNMDKIYDGMFDEFPQATDVQRAQFKAQMQQAFGEKSLRGSFQETFAMIPKKKIGINEKWNSTNRIESIISLKYLTTYALTAVNNGTYIIHGSATVRDNGTPEYKPYSNNRLLRIADVNGTSVTDLRLDRKTGWPVSSAVTKNIKCTGYMKDNTGHVSTATMVITGEVSVVGKY